VVVGWALVRIMLATLAAAAAAAEEVQVEMGVEAMVAVVESSTSITRRVSGKQWYCNVGFSVLVFGYGAQGSTREPKDLRSGVFVFERGFALILDYSSLWSGTGGKRDVARVRVVNRATTQQRLSLLSAW
jgi:hypothetical protein